MSTRNDRTFQKFYRDALPVLFSNIQEIRQISHIIGRETILIWKCRKRLLLMTGKEPYKISASIFDAMLKRGILKKNRNLSEHVEIYVSE